MRRRGTVGRSWSAALLACFAVAGCRPQPIPVAGDTVTVNLDELEPPDSISRQLMDSIDSRSRQLKELFDQRRSLRRLLQRPVPINGPTLIAVYPQLGYPGELSDPELSGFIRDFRNDLPKAKSIAAIHGLAYEERDGPSIALTQPFNNMLTRVSVDHGLVGFVIATPGLPPSILSGHVADSVLARAVSSYLAEARRQRSPPVSGS